MAKSRKKNQVKVDPEGQAHIQASFNNIIISLTNNSGQVISWSSAGKMGFKCCFRKRIEKSSCLC